MTARKCSVEGCDRKHDARGFCGMHGQRARRHGDPLAGGPGRILGDVRHRIEQYIERTESCWLWTGAIDTTGYGRFWDGERVLGAHRIAYEIYVGPIPEGLQLDHLCMVRACINPEHLEAVTQQENVRRENANRWSATTPGVAS